MSYKCAECSEGFASQKSLHAHIKKHGMLLGDYYVKNFPRFNKLTKTQLPFKNVTDYFAKDFLNHNQLLKWCAAASQEEVKEYILQKLKERVEEKNYEVAPSTVELFVSELPTMDIYKTHFGSYKEACNLCGVKPMFGKNWPTDTRKDCQNVKIYIDSREQKPLSFKNSEIMKLDVGDYSVGRDLYAHTHVDRKSFGDLCSTVTVGRERFERELQRAADLGIYVFVVAETNLYSIKDTNYFSPKRYNLDYVFHNLKEIQHKFYKNCQFVFSGNRSNSATLIPILLVNGPKLWEVDIQYFVDKGEVFE